MIEGPGAAPSQARRAKGSSGAPAPREAQPDRSRLAASRPGPLHGPRPTAASSAQSRAPDPPPPPRPNSRLRPRRAATTSSRMTGPAPSSSSRTIQGKQGARHRGPTRAILLPVRREPGVNGSRGHRGERVLGHLSGCSSPAGREPGPSPSAISSRSTWPRALSRGPIRRPRNSSAPPEPPRNRPRARAAPASRKRHARKVRPVASRAGGPAAKPAPPYPRTRSPCPMRKS